MNVTYTGTNPVFTKLVAELQLHPIVAAVSTGRFRSNDTANRNKYRITATLLDLINSPYSNKLKGWYRWALLKALHARCSCKRCVNCLPTDKYPALELDYPDINTEL